jgi:hypothetical protein
MADEPSVNPSDIIGVLGHDMLPDGRYRWRVMTLTGVKTLVTSSSSTASISEATIIYADALKRLASK